MKFLVIRLEDMGGIVLTTQVVRCLKQQLPLSEVHYLTTPKWKAVIAEEITRFVKSGIISQIG